MLRKLTVGGYESSLLKGGKADCHFIKNNGHIIHLINDNSIFQLFIYLLTKLTIIKINSQSLQFFEYNT